MDKWMNNNNFNKILALVFGIILFTMVHVDTAPSGQTTVDIKTKTIENVKIEVKMALTRINMSLNLWLSTV